MSAKKKKKKQDEDKGGAPAWMVTYGDLMSLLLTFFVLLLSFSTMAEPEKFNSAMQSIREALFILQGNPSPLPLDFVEPERDEAIDRLRTMARELRRRMQVRNLDENVDVELQEEEGMLQIRLPNEVLFASGSADLLADALPVLEDVAAVLEEIGEGRVDVRGHTDNVPIGSNRQFRDNYDLSYARAKTVTAALTRAGGLPLNLFEIIACGPSQPVATNQTPEGRAENRRVEILVRGKLDEADLERIQGVIEDMQPVPVDPPPLNPPQ